MSNVEHRGVRTDEQWEADRMEVIRRAFESDEMIVMTRDLPEEDRTPLTVWQRLRRWLGSPHERG